MSKPTLKQQRDILAALLGNLMRDKQLRRVSGGGWEAIRHDDHIEVGRTDEPDQLAQLEAQGEVRGAGSG